MWRKDLFINLVIVLFYHKNEKFVYMCKKWLSKKEKFNFFSLIILKFSFLLLVFWN